MHGEALCSPLLRKNRSCGRPNHKRMFPSKLSGRTAPGFPGSPVEFLQLFCEMFRVGEG